MIRVARVALFLLTALSLNLAMPRAAFAQSLTETGAIARTPGADDAASDPLSSALTRLDTGGVADGNAVRAVVRSVQNVTISSEINARIKSMSVREGDAFNQGDVLVQFDCARTIAELDAAEAAFHSRKAAYDGAAEMLRYKSAGTLAVDQARFEMEKAAAESRILEAKRDTCTITAPFKGRVVERLSQPYEVAQANQPLMKIAEASGIELALMIPSNWLGTVKNGTTFSVAIDETGATHKATVKQIGGAIDPVSKSIRVIADMPADVTGVAPGMSGTATFESGGRRQ